jgi:hypothetical protein
MQKNSKGMFSKTLEIMYDQKICKRHENVPYNFPLKMSCFFYGISPLIMKSPPLNPIH